MQMLNFSHLGHHKVYGCKGIPVQNAYVLILLHFYVLFVKEINPFWIKNWHALLWVKVHLDYLNGFYSSSWKKPTSKFLCILKDTATTSDAREATASIMTSEVPTVSFDLFLRPTLIPPSG